MEKAKAFLELTQGESDRVSSLAFPPHRLGTECSFYEYYSLRGIRVDRIEPGQVFCTFKVPPRLTVRQTRILPPFFPVCVMCMSFSMFKF
uniref:Acyl-CoA thioesterase n=1 Tax=Solanum tuberosum TaxID=4113 RepID=M1CZM4_SOLTU